MKPTRHFLIAAGLALLTLIVFAQAGSFEFINYDDNLYVFENPYVLDGLSAKSVRWAITEAYGGSWAPVTWLSLMLDAELFGTTAKGYHTTNIVLHVANVVLLFYLVRTLTGCEWRSAFVAALFAVHPLQVENVAWISERKDLLCTLFGFAAIAAYVQYVRRNAWKWYAAIAMCLVLSLMAKQMLVTLPFLLLLLDYWPLRRVGFIRARDTGKQPPPDDSSIDEPAQCRNASWRRVIAEKIPLLAIAVAFSGLVYWTQDRMGAVMSLESYSLRTRLENAILSYAAYLRKVVWPVDLAAFYPHPGENIAAIDLAVALAVLAAISIVAVALIRRRPAILVGWLWFLGSLVPVIGIVQIGLQQMSDRYTYVPLVGLFLALAWLFPSRAAVPGASREAKPGQSNRSIMLAAAAFVAVAACTVISWRQVSYWRNDLSLFRHALDVTEGNVVAHMNLAAALEDAQRYEEQISELLKALAVEPDNPYVHYSLGRAVRRLGRPQEAAEYFRRAIEQKPDYGLAHHAMGNLLFTQGRVDEALPFLEQAVEFAPKNVQAYYDLGNAYLRQERWDEAIDQYRTVTRLDATHVQAYHNCGIALARQGRYSDAVAQYQTALELGLSFPMAYYNLADALRHDGRHDEAIAVLQSALQAGQGNAYIHNQLGELLLERFDNRAAARRQFQSALRVDPNFEAARRNLEKLDKSNG